MSKKLVLVGGGGHCKSVIDTLIGNNDYDEIVITDKNIETHTRISGIEVVGGDEVLPKLFEQGFTDAFVTVGSIQSTKVRRILFEKVKETGFDIPVIIDSSAVVSPTAKIGAGTFVGKKAVINAASYIGNMAIINTGAIIEHECSIGDFTHISVGAVLCGNVCVGNDAFVGAGSTVIQGINIGNGAIVGAGSTVLRNIDNKSKEFGIVK